MGTILYNRGIESRETAWELLHASEDALHDPFLFAEMDVAVDRVLKAIEEGETIAVFGDFDTDGVTASALLYEALLALGGDAFVHLPHRVRDGHGLNAEAVEAIAESGASVIITVDCGITSGDEVRQAKQLGIDVILTDHHAPMGAPPEAFATVAPTSAYPFPFLTGAGLAFKLVQAIYQRLESPVPAGALELASLGTVADMAPLLGENRAIATLGLEKLRETERPGLLALLSAAGVDRESLDHESIPFIIAPRLNAAGRMDSAELAFSLLTEEDPLVLSKSWRRASRRSTGSGAHLRRSWLTRECGWPPSRWRRASVCCSSWASSSTPASAGWLLAGSSSGIRGPRWWWP